MDTLIHDIRYGLRLLRRSPGFTIVIVLTLGLGIGANAALFSFVDAVLLRALPYAQPEQLVAVKDAVPGANLEDAGMSQPELEDLQKRSGVFDEVSGVWPMNANLTGHAQPERLETVTVSPNYFAMLGAKAQLGRVIVPSDYRPGFSEGAVISDSLWRRMFGGAPDVLGKAIRLDGDLFTIVGVLPPDFRHPGRTLQQNVEVWTPAGFAGPPFPQPPLRRLRMIPGAIARLKPGLSIVQAQAKLDAFAVQLHQQYPNEYPATARWSPQLVPLQQEVVGNAGRMLVLLLAAVGAVLLIACVNIASLLLARSTSRYGEIAIRQALGAASGRLFRQTLTESVTLSLCGGVLGLALSIVLKRVLLRFVPASLPRLSEVALDWRALLFAFAISLLTGLLFGVVPALQMSDPHLTEKLRQGARSAGLASRQHRLLNALVIAEFALSLVLIVGAGLLLRSFWNALRVDSGMNPSHVVVAHVWLPAPTDPSADPYQSIEKRAAFVREVLRRLHQLPGVEQVAVSSLTAPVGRVRTTFSFKIAGRAVGAGATPSAELSLVSPDFFRTLGTPQMRGRAFTDADNETASRVAVIDQMTADLYWPGQDPVNQQVTLNLAAGLSTFTIVGITGRTRSDGLDAPYAPHLYLPMLQLPRRDLDVYLRTSESAESLEAPIRREVQAVDPTLPVFGVRALQGIVSDSLASRRFTMQVLGVLALAALLLAAIGIYGVMAYFVSQRIREIGVRMALGAQRVDVLRLVVGRGMLLATAGMMVGLVASLGLTRLMSGLLFGVSASDPLTLAMLTVLLAAVALLANFIPARRASRVDPMVALRYE